MLPLQARTSPAAAACASDARIWVHSVQPGGINELRRYAQDGTQVGRPIPVPRVYGDIAWSSDGQTLYAVDFDGAVAPSLRTLDPATGAETATVAITGAAGPAGASANALSAAADGTLLFARGNGRSIWKVDPATGVATLFASFPVGVTSGGDFLTLPDGDILALGTTEAFPRTQGLLYRIHPDATVTQIGTGPVGFGAAQAGDRIYLANNAGDLLSLDSVPTGPSTAPVSTTTVVNTTFGFNGASAIQDAGACLQDAWRSYDVEKSVSPQPVTAGDVATYTVTVDNTGTLDYAPGAASFEDDLSLVLDDGAIVPGTVNASAGTASVAGTTLSWTGPLPATGPGSTVTVSYQVRVNAPISGDQQLDNSVVPTGPDGICAGTCTTTTRIQIPATPAACPPATIWANGGTALNLYRYLTDGTQIGTPVPLARAYADIAWSADGETLYALGATGPVITLFTLDSATGDELSSVPITGITGTATANAGLSTASDGSLLYGNNTVNLYKVNPVTGVASSFAQLPTGQVTAGDFVTLPGGDVLALGKLSFSTTTSNVFRIAPNGTVTRIGSLPFLAQGASQTGGEVYVTNPAGDLLRLSSMPKASSTANLPTTTAFSTGITFLGAASVQDAGPSVGCVVDADMSYQVEKSSTPSGPVDPGDTVTYTVTATNTGVVPYPAGYAGFDDDLRDVLDDGTIVPNSATSSAGQLNISGGTLSWQGPLTTSGAGSTVTVTYQVRADGSTSGDERLRNIVAATGAAGTCGSCTTTTVVNDAPSPVARPDTGTTPQDTNITVPLLTNDTPGSGPHGTPGTFDPASVVFTHPTATNNGRTLVVAGEGTYTIDSATGNVTFDPLPGFTARTTPVAYQVTDGNGNTTGSTLTITVVGVPVEDEDDPVGQADLALSKRVVDGARVTPGGVVRYRLKVSNKGGVAASSPIKLKDPLPEGLELRSARGKGWNCHVRKASDTVKCVRNRALGADRKAPPVFVVAKATKAGLGLVVNIARVSGAGDSVRPNNADKASITVIPDGLPDTGYRPMPEM